MDYKNIRVSVEDQLGWIEYNRSPMNAFNWEMLREIPIALDQLLEDSQVRVIILGSALEKYFSVGADLQLFQGIGKEGMADWVTITHSIVRKMQQSDKPLLAAIHGMAVGGGLEIVLHCDVRFAADDAKFGQPEINIGFIPPVGTTQSLARLLGRPRAIRYLYEGTTVEAMEAKDIGLVDLIVPRENLRQEVESYAAKLAKKPAAALAAIRRTITEGGGLSFDDGLKMEFETAVILAETSDFEEGIQAFFEKRKPKWS